MSQKITPCLEGHSKQVIIFCGTPCRNLQTKAQVYLWRAVCMKLSVLLFNKFQFEHFPFDVPIDFICLGNSFKNWDLGFGCHPGKRQETMPMQRFWQKLRLNNGYILNHFMSFTFMVDTFQYSGKGSGNLYSDRSATQGVSQADYGGQQHRPRYLHHQSQDGFRRIAPSMVSVAWGS